MTIVDLTSMGEPQTEQQREINARLVSLQNEISSYCYQCAKCTSGCEAHKLLELEPHKIVALLKRGLINELVNSDIIWTCMTCMKCRERCPQRVAPIEILFALKNMAVASGKQIPGKYTAMLQSILSLGLIQDIQQITTRMNTTVKRDELGLPPLSKPTDAQKFQAAVMKIATEKV
ncbi:MAG: 4Fe-4S dicluster domain-containing protein [Candidatus Thermoplasmatota archaeon]|nr:4Fe-4S dicluster domain-containing protein [Candidatus Thermoplasmatota archaeon]